MGEQMSAIYEFTYSRRRVGEWDGRRPLTSPEAAAEFFAPLFEGMEREHVIVAALTRKHRPIGVETVYRGTVAGCSVRPAELVTFPIRVGAAALIVAHNHPSGDPTPSADDLRTTRDLVAAGRLLQIDVLDHLVVGDPGWVSIAERIGR
jgi:DNA repair protein RadC